MTNALSFYNRYFGLEIPVKIKFFNICCVASAALGIFSILFTLSFNGPVECLAISAFSVLFVFLLTFIGQRKKNIYSSLIIISQIVFNFVVIPGLFLTGGGIFGGYVCTFLLGITFTLFIVEGKKGIIMAVIESLYDGGICIYSYFNPDVVFTWNSNNYSVISMILGCIIVGLILSFSMKLMISMFQREVRTLSEIEQKHDELATLDPLTNLYGHDYAETFLKKEMKSAWDKKTLLSIMLISINEFDEINKRFGFHAGDNTLTSISNLLVDSFDSELCIARFSGRKFLIIFPNTADFVVKNLSGMIKSKVTDYNFGESDTLNVSISTSCIQYVPGITYDEYIEKAISNLK